MVGMTDANLQPGEKTEDPVFEADEGGYPVLTLEECKKECLGGLGPLDRFHRACAGVEWYAHEQTDGKAKCVKVWGCTALGNWTAGGDVYQLAWIDPDADPSEVSDDPLMYLKVSRDYRAAHDARVATEVARNDTSDSPSLYNQQLKKLLDKQATAVATSEVFHNYATAQAEKLSESESTYEVEDPAAGEHAADAAALATTVGSQDCDCAEQLYGSTTTTRDTSVALLARRCAC